MVPESPLDWEALREALKSLDDPEAHDRSMIVERLAWTPDQRL